MDDKHENYEHVNNDEEIQEWSLDMVSEIDDLRKQKKINNFKAEPNEHKRTVLIVDVNTDTPKMWTIAMFNDEGVFINKELIDDVNNELAIELNKEEHDKYRIIKLATSYLGLAQIQNRRDFLTSLGKYSKVVVATILGGGAFATFSNKAQAEFAWKWGNKWGNNIKWSNNHNNYNDYADSCFKDPYSDYPVKPKPKPKKDYVYAIVVVKNKTNLDILMNTRWGEGKWKKKHLKNGKAWRYYWKYDRRTTWAPKFFISFDSSTYNGYQTKEYNLNTYISKDADSKNAKIYTFKKTSSTEIDLFG